MRTKPAISVLVPARNAAAFLNEALCSLAGQTMRDFEAIIVDDGSTDETGDIARGWALRDARFVVVTRPSGGIGAALNSALEKSRGSLVARMDADDCSRPTRFAEQLSFMAARPQIAVCGTWARTFGTRRRHTWRPPADDDHIRAGLLFDAVMIHPTTVLRRECFVEEGGYRAAASPAEDFELWHRLIKKHRFANIPKVLLDYRLHPSQATAGLDLPVDRANEVRTKIMESWWSTCPEEDQKFHIDLCSRRLPVLWTNLVRAEAWLSALSSRTPPPFGASQDAWLDIVAGRWLEACRHFRSLGFGALRLYLRSPLRRSSAVKRRRELRLSWDVILAAAGSLPPKRRLS